MIIMATNSIVGRLTGLLAYTDNTTASFSATIEVTGRVDISWGSDNANDKSAASDSEFSNQDHKLKSIIESIPGITSVIWTPTSNSDKIIKDQILHLSLTSTDSTGVYPLSITYEKGRQIDHLIPANAIDSTYVTKLLSALSVLTSDTPRIYANKSIKVVDLINDGQVRKVYIFIRNVAIEDDSENHAWQQIHLNGNSYEIAPESVTKLRGTIDGVIIPLMTPTVGRKYAPVNGVFTDIGAASNPTYIAISNSNAKPLVAESVKDDAAVETFTVLNGQTKVFRYQNSIYIHATLDMASDFTLAEASANGMNTQINLTGLASADLNMALAYGQYQFSLSNIVYL